MEDLLTYFSVSQGYRGAAFNGQAFNDPAELNFAAPEKLTSYEIGLKTELWNRRGTFNVAVFHYDYRNQQFLDAFALPGGLGTGFHTVNAPEIARRWRGIRIPRQGDGGPGGAWRTWA